MTEQQYRVIADRDKGDDMLAAISALEDGDRVTYIYDTEPSDMIVRIERPVPNTDGEPHSAAAYRAYFASNVEGVNHSATAFRAGWDAAQVLIPSVPTREQFAEELIEKLRATGSVPVDRIWARWRELFREYDDAALAKKEARRG